MEPFKPPKLDRKTSFRVKKKWFISTTQGKSVYDFYAFKRKKKSSLMGTGTYGNVYKCVHLASSKVRAVKEIPKKRIRKKQRFLCEIEILRNLDHPNICKMYESYEDEKFIYIIMEKCDGGELFDRIIDTGIFKETDARNIFVQIMHAINYMHKNKICHRDLKPENFLFKTKEKDSQIKVIDFGLSKVFGEDLFKINETVEKQTLFKISKGKRKRKGGKDVLMNTRAGTPYYIAPEVIAGEYNESCDIWSVGVILYVLLCGYPPFYGDNDNDIMRNVRVGKYDFPREEWDNVDRDAISLIKHMICKQKNRYTAQEVLDSAWCQKHKLQKQKTNLKVNFDSLKKWRSFEKFKKICLTLIASQLDDQEIKGLRDQFQKMDQSGDGSISITEFKKALKSQKVKGLQNFDQVFSSVDSQKNGQIDYTEFLAASLKKSQYMKQERLRAAFQVFDQNGDGVISANELQQILGQDEFYKDKPKSFWDNFLKESDLNNDGTIDFNEFVNMMNQ